MHSKDIVEDNDGLPRCPRCGDPDFICIALKNAEYACLKCGYSAPRDKIDTEQYKKRIRGDLEW
jgi:ribosomal protein S27AE